MNIFKHKFIQPVLLSCIAVTMMVTAKVSIAQASDTQYFPVLSYRTGPYGPNGAPWANGLIDYFKLINARDNGINGVRISWEECEFGYATDRGVECYERLKGRGMAAAVQPLSTGVTFALTDKAPDDQIPILTIGYGRSESQNGRVFPWNFPIGGSYWTAADVLIQYLAQKDNGLKGKKIALIYHDSPFGKEPIPVLEKLSKELGYQFIGIPVPHPGVEQRSAWLQIRRDRPDYVILWGWGVMNTTAIREAIATNYPRDRMYGSWWSGSEVDIGDLGESAKGYNAITLQHSAGRTAVHEDLMKFVHGAGQGTGPAAEVGSVLYNRGLISAMIAVEGVRAAQAKYGNKPLPGSQTRWGYENLNISDADIKRMGFEGLMREISTSCDNHLGSSFARIQTWDGSKWVINSEWFEADMTTLQPMINAASAQYAQEKGITPRTDAQCKE